MKKLFTLFLGLFLVAGFSAMAEDFNSPPPAVEAADIRASATVPSQPGAILLLDNAQGDGAAALNVLGYSYTNVAPGDLPSVNLDDFDIIFVVWQPVQAMVDALNGISAALEAWISSGGHIVVNAETYEMVTNPYSFLPVPFTVDPGWHHENGVLIVDPGHYLATNLTSADLDGWVNSVHGWITAYPPEAEVVSVATNPDPDTPHVMGMCYGAGTIVVVASDPEWHIRYGGLPAAIQLLANELNYIGPCVIEVLVDIKPGSCPNPLNPKSQGSVPVAIVGTEDFDPVAMVNPSSVTLAGVPMNGIVEIVDSTTSDFNNPDPEECEDCFDAPDEYAGDGYDDLVVKFDTQALVAAIADMGGAASNGCIDLVLEGATVDGVPIIGGDAMLVRKGIEASPAPSAYNLTTTWGNIKSR